MKNHFHPLIWLVASAFVLLQFFLQLSSGVVIDLIRQEIQLTALSAGLLSGLFYVIYTALQIPVGILCDRKNPRPILACSALICSLGCLVFAASHNLTGLYIGRSLIALGSAFGFVCLTHLVREHYPRHLFGLLIGTSETLSFLATVLGIIGMGAAIKYWGWRAFIDVAALFACLIAYLCWQYIPNKTIKNAKAATSQLKQVLTSIPLWINGLFIGLTFMLVTVFGALWAPPFIQIKLGCSLRQASLIDALFIFGVGLSCPLFGYLAQKIKSRIRLITCACLMTASMLLFIIYCPIHNLWLMACLMLCLGLISGSYILGYTIANELSPPEALSTTTGMTNTLALIITPLLQPFIGYMLDTFHSEQVTLLANYQRSLLILPLCILIAAILVIFLPKTKNTSYKP